MSYATLLAPLRALDLRLADALACIGDVPDARAALLRPPGAPRFDWPAGALDFPLSLGAQGPLGTVGESFALTPFELDLIVIAVAPEIDARYARLFGELRGDERAGPIDVDLALDLLCRDAAQKLAQRELLSASARLRRHGLLRLDADMGASLLGQRLIAGDGLIQFLLGQAAELGSGGLAQWARPVGGSQSWADLVLPAAQTRQLHQLCDRMRHRARVEQEWGFGAREASGRSVCALFTGPSGVGKTMAAGIVARSLALDLYRVDLAQTVSKYIGETEKNLAQIFAAASAGGAVLLFDEADTLFGKRTEIKDAHDRYANLEVGYLLQKIEEYDGMAILATNLRGHIDDAFIRRLSCIVEFPFPDGAQRERIWRAVIPAQAPLAADVDFAALAREVRLAGGNLRNIALAAAYLAASDDGVIAQAHLLAAARAEHQKIGRTL